MDLGDLLGLIGFAIIAVSVLSGFFGGRSGEEGPSLPRPTDVFHSGGEPPRPRPDRTETAEPMARELSWEDAPAGRQVEPERFRTDERDTSTYDDAIERGDVAQTERRLPRRAPDTLVGAQTVQVAERELLERDLTDMSAAMDLDPERRRRERQQTTERRRRRRTDAQILRGWLEDPDTLVNSFIMKEVLDVPISLREK